MLICRRLEYQDHRWACIVLFFINNSAKIPKEARGALGGAEGDGESASEEPVIRGRKNPPTFLLIFSSQMKFPN